VVLTMLSFFGGNPSGNVDKSKYEHLTMSIRQTVLERARRRCQQCSVKFSPSVHPGFEHINGSLKDNRPNNLRALCPECFKLVAKKENRKGMVGNIRYAFGRMIK
jgi:5-methylcytosine-specific restriction endonuclease McrA